MAKLVQSVEFFVVGSPVQPDRACYIERRADRDLLQSIVDQRFAYVLASRGSGKSSLMVRCIRTLRAEGQSAALVDLTQIGARGESSDASRWFYSMAHRIVRELRLKVELQSWWQERSALGSEQRFADFFGEIVLECTDKPVTIFIDEIERAADLPFAPELFSVIWGCYALRVSEPAYRRLNFVVLGAASPTELCPDAGSSPFVDGDSIGLNDFSIEECYHLAPGFELGTDIAQGLLDRIYSWTRGQPYLTQKVARAVARRGGRLEDIERIVQELFLSPSASGAEPLLAHMRGLLTTRSPQTRAALQLLARLASGQNIPSGAMPAAQQALQIAGVVAVDRAGNVEIRNRIFREVFTDKWAKSAMPFNWRGSALAAVVLIVALFVPYWYVTHLPRPYIETLSGPNVDFEEAEDAYAKLHRLPGFVDRADALFAEVLATRSRSMTTLPEVAEVDSILRGLNGQVALADRLLGEFWLRQAREAFDTEDRDAGLLYAIEAMPGRAAEASALVAQLVSDDYEGLERSFRLARDPEQWGVDWANRAITVIDAERRVRRIALDAQPPGENPADGDSSAADSGLTALQPVPLVRELSVDRDGSSGEFDLQMVLDHPAPEELSVMLTAPSGAAVRLPLSETYRTRDGLTLTSRSELELGALADEPRQGVWRLTLVDGVAGNSGVLHRWTLQFGDVSETWRGAPVLGTEIPDPVRTEPVRVDLSRDGRVAVARTGREGDIGALAVWRVSDGLALVKDLPLERSADFVELTRNADHLLVVSGDTLSIFNVESRSETGRIDTQTEFLQTPTISPEGSYVAIAERVDGGAPLFSLIRIADGELVASVEGIADVKDWVLGPEARFLALLGVGREVTIMDPRRGAIIARLELDRPPLRVMPIAGEDLLLTVDAVGDVRAWRFAIAQDGLMQLEDWRLGTTVDPASISVAMNASSAVFATAAGRVVVHDLGRARAPVLLRAERPAAPIRTNLSPDGTALLTSNGNLVRVWNVESREPVHASDQQLSVLAIGEEGRIAALGYRGGYVRVESLSALGQTSTDEPGIDFIGHRGPVTSIAIMTGQNLIASGGNDGVVRLWNLASASPTDKIMRHPSGPVATVALSADGQWLASGGEASARVWRVADGSLAAEYAVNGTARAVGFSADGRLVGVGDSTGNVFVGSVDAEQPIMSVRADGGVESLAFSKNAKRIATGDALGNVRIWEIGPSASAPLAMRFRQPVQWLAFTQSDERLLVQTDQWLHRLNVSSESLEIDSSRLLPVNLERGAAYVDGPEPLVRLVGGVDVGHISVAEFSFSRSANVATEPTSDRELAYLDRDWGRVLGLELDANGLASPILY